MNNKYQLEPITENDYEFIYQVKKNVYKKYVEANWGTWDEEMQRHFFEKFIEIYKNNIYTINLNNQKIGFYQGETLENGDYEVGNICIIPEYQGKGIGFQILIDVLEENQDKNIHIQHFKQNTIGRLYEKLGFIPNGETKTHYQMLKQAKKTKRKEGKL